MSGHLSLSADAEGTLLPVKVSPGSSREGLVGLLGDRLKVAVRAPPEKGKANRALLDLLTRVLELPRGTLELVAGAGSSLKTVRARGIRPDTLERALDHALATKDDR